MRATFIGLDITAKKSDPVSNALPVVRPRVLIYSETRPDRKNPHVLHWKDKNG
jgi:hypothetical protein